MLMIWACLFQVAGIRVRLHELKDELSESVEKQDFERAAQLKTDISNLDAEYSSLLEESKPKIEEVRIQKVTFFLAPAKEWLSLSFWIFEICFIFLSWLVSFMNFFFSPLASWHCTYVVISLH